MSVSTTAGEGCFPAASRSREPTGTLAPQPNSSTSPAVSTARSTRTSFTKMPFVERLSMTSHSELDRCRSVAWTRETFSEASLLEVSLTTTSHAAAFRPMHSSRPMFMLPSTHGVKLSG
eukprot:SAG11_NODE_2909_length_2845_cov_3.209395_2_plen_119_part_00